MVDHPNAKVMSVVVMNLDGEKRVLMVDTDLKMDGEDPAHEPNKIFSLHKACQSFVEKSPILVDTYLIRAWK
ncbi:hypothetical protein AB4099_33480 [Bosea sp. 2KB_26]|uniref:hypothetical protein n=1 Tax=Bosea sp. 2KB_26 TaxID=3237475 RepID=UPI003F9270E9